MESINSNGQQHHKPSPRVIGDSFFARPVESYPVENSLALTSSFIYSSNSGTGKSIKMGHFEVDVLWLYILGALIIIPVARAIASLVDAVPVAVVARDGQRELGIGWIGRAAAKLDSFFQFVVNAGPQDGIQANVDALH